MLQTCFEGNSMIFRWPSGLSLTSSLCALICRSISSGLLNCFPPPLWPFLPATSISWYEHNFKFTESISAQEQICIQVIWIQESLVSWLEQDYHSTPAWRLLFSSLLIGLKICAICLIQHNQLTHNYVSVCHVWFFRAHPGPCCTAVYRGGSLTQLAKATTHTDSDTFSYVHLRPSLVKRIRSFFKSVCSHLHEDRDQQDHVCITLNSDVWVVWGRSGRNILHPHGPSEAFTIPWTCWVSVSVFFHPLFWRVSHVRLLHLRSLSAHLVTCINCCLPHAPHCPLLVFLLDTSHNCPGGWYSQLASFITPAGVTSCVVYRSLNLTIFLTIMIHQFWDIWRRGSMSTPSLFRMY